LKKGHVGWGGIKMNQLEETGGSLRQNPFRSDPWRRGLSLGSEIRKETSSLKGATGKESTVISLRSYRGQSGKRYGTKGNRNDDGLLATYSPRKGGIKTRSGEKIEVRSFDRDHIAEKKTSSNPGTLASAIGA